MASPVLTETLFRDRSLCVDHLRREDGPAPALAVSFSSFGDHELDGPGYAGDFLLEQGYDVLAFKLAEDTWYQGVPSELFSWLRLRMVRFRYTRRVGYGSSMGAYAVIQFSARLALDQVMAYSPQYTVEGDFDPTWTEWTRQLEFQYRIDASSIAPDCRYLLLYDNRNLDRKHIQALQRVIPAAQLSLVAVPFAGHPVDPYLQDIGQLKAAGVQGLRLGHLNGLDLRSGREHSRAYLATLSLEAHHRGRPLRSLRLIERALRSHPEDPEFHSHRSALLAILDEPEQALEAAREGIARCPGHHDLMAFQASMHERLGQPQEALQAISQALEYAPDPAVYQERYEALRAAN